MADAEFNQPQSRLRGGCCGTQRVRERDSERILTVNAVGAIPLVLGMWLNEIPSENIVIN